MSPPWLKCVQQQRSLLEYTAQSPQADIVYEGRFNSRLNIAFDEEDEADEVEVNTVIQKSHTSKSSPFKS